MTKYIPTKHQAEGNKKYEKKPEVKIELLPLTTNDVKIESNEIS